MEENKETVEKTVDQPIEQVEETKGEQPRDKKGRFKSTDDGIVKIDLSKPPLSNEVVEQKENVVVETETKEEVVS